MVLKKKLDKVLIVLVAIIGVSVFSPFTPSSDVQAAAKTSYTTQFNSYNKQATNLINSASKVKSRTTALSLYRQMDRLEDKLDRLEDQVERVSRKGSSHYKLLSNIDRLDNRLDNAMDRLEDRFGFDD